MNTAGFCVLKYIQEVFFAFFPLQMLGKSLLKFSEKNFSGKYSASIDGECTRIRPLALIVKRRRSMLKRPFGKSELIIREGLEKYVEGGREEEFCKALNAMITEESLLVEPKASRRARYALTT